MIYPVDQVQELKSYCQGLKLLKEGDIEYLLLDKLVLPEGSDPNVSDALFCPVARDGYSSRLFFPQQVQGRFPRNWNGTCRIGERNWVAYSWKIERTGMTLKETLLEHLSALVRP
jgi:hypothetical protein